MTLDQITSATLSDFETKRSFVDKAQGFAGHHTSLFRSNSEVGEDELAPASKQTGYGGHEKQTIGE
jgi:hypothetical protein